MSDFRTLIFQLYFGCRHTDVVRSLLIGSANPNQTRTDGGATAAMMAAQSGHLDSVQLLVAFGADRTAQAQFPDGKVHTAESIADAHGHTDSVAAWLRTVDLPEYVRAV